MVLIFIQYGKYFSPREHMYLLRKIFIHIVPQEKSLHPGETIFILRGKNVFQERLTYFHKRKESDARGNLPHIGNSKGIKFVLQRFFLTILSIVKKNRCRTNLMHLLLPLPFLSRNLYGRYPSKFAVLYPGSKNCYRNCRQICSKVKFA
jgi:hypothetical protein